VAAAGLSDASYSYECNETLVFEEIKRLVGVLLPGWCLRGRYAELRREVQQKRCRDSREKTNSTLCEKTLCLVWRCGGGTTRRLVRTCGAALWGWSSLGYSLRGHVGC
jgi:hypothetical protein